MIQLKQASAAAALMACASMATAPASAADIPAPVVQSASDALPQWDAASENVEHRRYRRHRHRHYRGRSGVSDVLAGALIIGGIAAVASAASKNRDRDYRYRDGRDRDYRSDNVSGLDRAANICVAEIERDVRVENIDSVDRTAAGWRVTGALFDGQGFTCTIGNDGRIDAIDYGAPGTTQIRYSGEDRQYDDDRYTAAWANVDAGDVPAPVTYPRSAPSSSQPAYPGGPVDGDLPEDDGRYSAGNAEDFGG